LFKTIRRVDGYDGSEHRMKFRTRGAVRTVLVVALVILAGAPRNAAQVTIPPTASLDVHVLLPPTPVKIDGRSHLAYELRVTNYRTVELSLPRLDILDATRRVLASYEGSSLAEQMAIADLPAFSVDAYRTINSVEIALVVTIVFVAAFMARGAWLF
jgi:hypothetical protein